VAKRPLTGVNFALQLGWQQFVTIFMRRGQMHQAVHILGNVLRELWQTLAETYPISLGLGAPVAGGLTVTPLASAPGAMFFPVSLGTSKCTPAALAASLQVAPQEETDGISSALSGEQIFWTLWALPQRWLTANGATAPSVFALLCCRVTALQQHLTAVCGSGALRLVYGPMLLTWLARRLLFFCQIRYCLLNRRIRKILRNKYRYSKQYLYLRQPTRWLATCRFLKRAARLVEAHSWGERVFQVLEPLYLEPQEAGLALIRDRQQQAVLAALTLR
jgi:hypothetical protein